MTEKKSTALHDHGDWPAPAAAAHRLCSAVQLAQPLWRYGAALAAEGGFLLDSAMDPQRLGRYSYLGEGRVALLTARRGGFAAAAGEAQLAQVTITLFRLPDGSTPAAPLTISWRGDPFTALRELLAVYRPAGGASAEDKAGDPPFRAGAVGYIGYEAAHFIEALPDTTAEETDLPDIAVMLCDSLLVHDHRHGSSRLLCTGRGADPAAARRDAVRQREGWLERLAAPENAISVRGPTTRPTATDAEAAARPTVRIDADLGIPIPVRAQCDREAYCRAVDRIRDHIHAGDVFEVCLTQRLEADLPTDAWSLYRELRRINPAPFASFLRLPFASIVSASPERFLELSADGRMESRPIKGTRPRGADAAEDARLRRDLAEADKDRAENVMIVDLVRNDLGRVARIGSVSVPELCVIESYATVFQLVSTVRAELAPGHDAMDLLRATFPGGSMTGAPKIEALRIIDRLEGVQRGVYAGAIGWFDYEGAMDLGMVIRTVICRDGKATFGVGGAVTADSDPAAEYSETLDKARALVQALANLGRRDAARG